MATFFFSLSLRASQQVLEVEDPLRCWIVKLILPCEVASVLLIVQIGVFTNPLLGLLAFLLLLLMGMWYSYRSEGKNVSGAYAYRMSVHTQRGVSSSFASELSVLEADRNARTLILSVLVRASCSVIMLITIQRLLENSSSSVFTSYTCLSVGEFGETISYIPEADIFNKACVPAWLPLMFYIYLPHVAICLLVLLFLLDFIRNQASTLCCGCCGFCGGGDDDADGRDEEDAAATLRKKIRRKAEELQAKQESGSLGSVFWARRSLELKLFMFAFDFLMDCWCCWQYIASMNYFFAACQGAIIVVSIMVQFFRVRGHSLTQELAASWTSGMPTDLIFRVLLVEKAVEAPLSLCLQYFSAFDLAENLQAFLSLIFSIMLSIQGIAEGRYLSIMLWDMAKKDPEPKAADPEPATDPDPEPATDPIQSVLPKDPPGTLPPPPGMPKDPPGMLPPPPGMASKIGSSQPSFAPIQLDGQHIKDTE